MPGKRRKSWSRGVDPADPVLGEHGSDVRVVDEVAPHAGRGEHPLRRRGVAGARAEHRHVRCVGQSLHEVPGLA